MTRPLWYRLEALRLPLVTSGGLAPVRVRQGHSYRGRLKLSGLAATFGGKSDVVEGLQKLGFAQVQAWDKPAQLPADWPADQRAPASSGATWWVQGVWSQPDRDFDPSAKEGDGVTFLWVAEVPSAAAPTTPAPAPGTTPPAPPAPDAPPPGPERHKWARGILAQAWPQARPGEVPTLAELQMVQALAAFDGGYGRGYTQKPELQDCHNWGAIHQGFPLPDGTCPPGGKLSTDFSAAKQAKYPVCFKCYQTDVDGAADVIRQMTAPIRKNTGQAMKDRRTVQDVSRALFVEKYFGGFHKDDPERNVTEYANNLWSKLQAIAAAVGEPVQFERGEPHPEVWTTPAGQLPTRPAPTTTRDKLVDSGAGPALAAVLLGALPLLRRMKR